MFINNEKYDQIIFNLAEIIKSKNLEISLYKSEITELKRQLEKAEREDIK